MDQFLKKKDGYKLELHTPKAKKLFGSTKDKTNNGKSVSSLEKVEQLQSYETQ